MMELLGRFHRSRRHRVLGGVAGGLADTLGLPPWIVRAVFTIGAFATGFVPVVLLYAALWVVLPRERVPLLRR